MCERCAKGLKTRFSFARSRPPIWRRDGTSRLKQAPAIVPEISLQNPRQVEPVFICAGEGGIVPGVGVAHDAAGGIVPQYARDAARGVPRPVADDYHSRVLRKPHADSAAMMDGDPGGAAGA